MATPREAAARSFETKLLEPIVLPRLDPTQAGAKPAPGDPRRVALFVCHGMGQQVRFETLEQVARRVGRAEGLERPEIGVRRVRVGQGDDAKDIYRVEVELGAEGNRTSVHLYEAYWASLTEDRVKIRDVIGFLWRAAWNGAMHARAGMFKRWMFGRPIRLQIDRTTTQNRLYVALAVVWSLVILNAVITAVGFTRFFSNGQTTQWPTDSFLILLGGVLTVLLVVCGLAGAFLSKDRRDWTTTPSGMHKTSGTTLALLQTALGSIIAAGAVVIVAAAWTFGFDPGWTLAPWMIGPLILLWLLTYGLSLTVRYFLIQYMGDVAAYVSAHAVSKFAELRAAIQKVSIDTARAVYTALRQDGEAFEYGRVLVMGHSLGSVIAYDALNAIIRDDMVARTHVDAVKRTPLFLSFGSPLNKTAFIFSTQMNEGDEIRETLAAAVQPMIQSYECRPSRWINIHSKADWISGRLEFYDDVAKPGEIDEADERKRVQNIIDPDATTPLLAHTEYWSSPLLTSTIREALASNPYEAADRDSIVVVPAEPRHDRFDERVL